jgi:hypothetical protein
LKGDNHCQQQAKNPSKIETRLTLQQSWRKMVAFLYLERLSFNTENSKQPFVNHQRKSRQSIIKTPNLQGCLTARLDSCTLHKQNTTDLDSTL